MVGTTIGVAYPGLYALPHAHIIPSDTDAWYVDTHRCVSFTVFGEPWEDPPTTWALAYNTLLVPCLTFTTPPPMVCGTPMKVGTFTFTITATDATGRVITFSYTMTVRPKP